MAVSGLGRPLRMASRAVKIRSLQGFLVDFLGELKVKVFPPAKKILAEFKVDCMTK